MFVPWVHARSCAVAGIALGMLGIGYGTAAAGASSVPPGFADEQIVGSLDEPVGIARVPDPASVLSPRLVFVEQRTARVGLIIDGVVSTVGVVPGVESGDTERGLLGIAVDPRWPAFPYVYVHCTDQRSGNHIAISRFTLTGDLGFTTDGRMQFSSASRFDLLNDLPDNVNYHNGGTVRFGIDGYLYVSLGDDGVSCYAPDSSRLQGKILRLDVSRLPAGPGGPAPKALLIPPGNPFASSPDSSARLVWSIGLRNPFRFQVDPVTGALFVGDVGENTWEELDRVASGGGNFGWPYREGPADYFGGGNEPPNLIEPIAYYDHGTGVVIVSAGIYRSPAAAGPPAFPSGYDGTVFFLDYYVGFMRRIVGSGTSWVSPPEVPGQPSPDDWGEGFVSVSDMTEMPDGTLWYCRQSEDFTPGTGEIRRIRSTTIASVPPAMSAALRFEAPTPTPSAHGVTLSWTQPRAAVVRLIVLDTSGRIVRTIESGARLEAGSQRRNWDGRDASGRTVAPGVYLARLEADHAVRFARIVVIGG